MHLLALLGLLQTEMIDFSTLSYNSACEIPTPFIYLKPGKKYPFRVEPTLYKVHVFGKKKWPRIFSPHCLNIASVRDGPLEKL